MSKPKIDLAPLGKRRKFGTVNRGAFAVALFAVEHPGKWVRVKGMTSAMAYSLHRARPAAFEPAGAYLGRFRDGKAYVKFVGTLGIVVDADYDGERREVVLAPDGSWAIHPLHGKMIAKRIGAFVDMSTER